MSWHQRPLAAFDIETTGTDVDTDRIVTAALWHITPATGHTTVTEWLANPGIDIPEAATAIHGITTDHAHTHGRPATDVVAEISRTLAHVANQGQPLVVYNAAFDLTLLDRELRRHGHHLPFHGQLRVIDPLVLDKHLDTYRKGSRRLADVCTHHGIPLPADQAHGAAADALAAARLAWKLATLNPNLSRMDPDTLHHAQTAWRAHQATSLQDYLRRTKDPQAVVDTAWPLIPHA